MAPASSLLPEIRERSRRAKPELVEQRDGAALADVAGAVVGGQAADVLLDVVKSGRCARAPRVRHRRAGGLVHVEELAPDVRPAGGLA